MENTHFIQVNENTENANLFFSTYDIFISGQSLNTANGK